MSLKTPSFNVSRTGPSWLEAESIPESVRATRVRRFAEATQALTSIRLGAVEEWILSCPGWGLEVAAALEYDAEPGLRERPKHASDGQRICRGYMRHTDQIRESRGS